ncbi:MAG: GFA family protein [Sphingomicrobium sp.]
MSKGAHEGSCRCGAVRFEAAGAPLITMACHCGGCQKMTGSAYSLSSLYPAERFSVTDGQTIRGGKKTGPNHQFCPECMSWIYTVPEGMDAFVNVRAPMFDDAAEHRPYVEMCRSEALPGAATGAVRSYDQFPQESEFSELLSAYAAWDGRVKQ